MSQQIVFTDPPYARDKYPRWDGCSGCKSVHLSTGPDDTRCAACRQKDGDPPLSVPVLPPWYETMPPEELERIRAKRPVFADVEEQPDMAKPVQSRIDTNDYGKPIVFEMTYRTEAGGSVTLMVGKTIPHTAHGLVFFHAAGDDRSEGQAHAVTDSPCPVDVILAEKLAAIGITYFYAYDRNAEVLYRATVADIRAAPTAVYSAKTTRVRHFLDRSGWQTLTQVVERVLPDRRTRQLERGGAPILTIPYVNTMVTLGIAELF